MSMVAKLQKIAELAGFLAFRPALSFHLLSQLPNALKGFSYSEGFSDAAAHAPGPASGAGASADPDNPLRAFFDARETGRGIWKWLHYFDVYHRHLGKFVGRDVNVLEIGVYSGGSLEMWRHYFGNGCHVYGVDLESACKTYENDYTDIFIGDQQDRGFWRDFKRQVPAVDVLIDDGGHDAAQQIVTLEEMLPHLRPGGVYLCEDVHGVYNGFCSYAQGLVNNLNGMQFADPGLRHKGGIAPTPFQAWIQSVHFYPYVAVIEKADRPLDRLIAPKHGSEWQPFL